MTTNHSELSRRRFLRGLGACIALPGLEALTPLKALAAGGAGTALGAGGQFPVRMAFLFVPNGVHLPDWTPEKEGAAFDLPYSLEPLKQVKNDVLVLSGLTHDKGRANDDGAGDHARSAGVFLTGAQPLKSEGSKLRAGISADQYAAARIGGATRFASMEIGTEGGRPYGKCDSGYGCAYSNNISWKDETTPMAKLTNPRAVFERLFANEFKDKLDPKQAKRIKYRKSILDYVMEDTHQLEKKVSQSDKQKLDEYLTSIREIEKRIESAEQSGSGLKSILSDYEIPDGTPQAFDNHARLLGDMMVLAFQTDMTRICSFMLANAGSNRSYREIGVREGHHSLSHHQGDPKKHAKLRDINRYHVTQLAYVLERLKSIPEGDGTLLDNSMIMYGSGLSDGNRHNNENLPILLAGGGGGTISTGRHIKFPEETPVCNLLNEMLDRVGAKVDYFGDSTGRLGALTG